MKRLSVVVLRASLTLALAGCAEPPPPPPNCPAAPPPAQAPLPATAAPAPKPASGVDGVAERVVAALNAKDVKALSAMFDTAMNAAVPPETLGPMAAGIQEKKGRLVSIERLAGGDERNATFRFKAERGDWHVTINLDREGKIAGLRLNEPPEPEPPVAKSTLALGLPFKGQWSVFWGGDREEVNYHVKAPSQRRAADLVVVDAEGKSHQGDGKKNEDYYAYGRDILAVADGTVLQAIDGVVDNAPGVMSPLVALGNSVVIEHAAGAGGSSAKVYSFYAHLKTGTVKVKNGAKVKKGAVLGLCGNSGNTSEPHLHFQLQDGPLVDHSWGIEPVFTNVTITRARSTALAPTYTWLKGDLVGEPLKNDPALKNAPGRIISPY